MSAFSTVRILNLKVADEIASKAIEAATRNSFKPICVCVMDTFGNPIVTKRMDGCPPNAYAPLASAKANTCIAVSASSRAYGAKYLTGKDGNFVGPERFARVLNQITAVDGQMAAFQGGILVRDKESGSILGSVGISGAAGDEDEYCALAGVKECSGADSLVTEPADHSCTTTKE